MSNVVFAPRNLRSVLVCTIILLVVVSGTLSVTPLPQVHACNLCNFQLTWGTFGSGNGQFSIMADSWGVAVDPTNGNVYVTDTGNNRVEEFTSTGTYLSQLGCSSGACSSGSGNGQFNAPYGVAVDSGGNVYVVDQGNDRVEKFTNTGAFIRTWGSLGSGNGQFNTPYGVAVDSSANVYVTDNANYRVEKFSSTGSFLLAWGSYGTGNGQFAGAEGVAVDPISGNVYVTDSLNFRVEKFTSTGAWSRTWGGLGTGKGQFLYPVGVAFDSSGNVYIVDRGNDLVEKFTSTGTFITSWGTAGSPAGVAVDASGNVYVVDFSLGRVDLFGDSLAVSVSLVPGWNLVSLPLVPVSTKIGSVLAGLILSGNLTIVWSYQGGMWKSFSPPSTGSLTTMQDGFGYWIYVTTPSTLLMFGYVVPPGQSTPPSYALSAGWNLVGFEPPNSPPASETVGQYLTNLAGKYSSVEIYTSATGMWTAATGSTTVYLGQALWIYMTSPATFIPA